MTTNIIVLIAALMGAEGNPSNDTEGKDGELGCMQIRPIFVEDVNRILGYEKYNLEDRRDRVKSIQMVVVFFSHYSGRFEEKYGEPPTYKDLALIYNMGWQGYRLADGKNGPALRFPYWIKVEEELDRLGNW